jgi:hypothetical protein
LRWALTTAEAAVSHDLMKYLVWLAQLDPIKLEGQGVFIPVLFLKLATLYVLVELVVLALMAVDTIQKFMLHLRVPLIKQCKKLLQSLIIDLLVRIFPLQE